MTQVARDAGIRIATSWQDASQIQHRYGPEQANTLISASQTRIILPGCSDPATRELVRNSIGEPARDSTGARTRRTDRPTAARLKDAHQPPLRPRLPPAPRTLVSQPPPPTTRSRSMSTLR